jgi:hypothetical protein
MEVARRCGHERIVSVLEGGYVLEGLKGSWLSLVSRGGINGFPVSGCVSC